MAAGTIWMPRGMRHCPSEPAEMLLFVPNVVQAEGRC